MPPEIDDSDIGLLSAENVFDFGREWFEHGEIGAELADDLDVTVSQLLGPVGEPIGGIIGNAFRNDDAKSLGPQHGRLGLVRKEHAVVPGLARGKRQWDQPVEMASKRRGGKQEFHKEVALWGTRNKMGLFHSLSRSTSPAR